ncbi:DUF6623 family protein [Bacillus thuringiensis]|uniref:DUF6623 family protein n=1 Tax=Bacillus thuringiensis TaxID=1428 RepID=UPI0022499AB1|nr:DUF6623 family protein [Bacillus thuringiensis]
MAITAMWTHGNVVVSETPEGLTQFTRFGFGTQVRTKTGTNHWFHAPMPTPVLQNGYRPKLKQVFILGNSSISSCIRMVHLYDGVNKVREQAVFICGNKLAIQPDNTISVGTVGTAQGLNIFTGLSISMLIEAGSHPKDFFFSAFGSDWE